MDQVDDVEAAESLIARLGSAYIDIVSNAFCAVDTELIREASEWCRPTCNSHGNTGRAHFCDDGVPSEHCGCPCHGGDDG
jgi:hypothetical protein